MMIRIKNMRVRVLRGKTFCSRNGRMVVGEMKVNFLLVDLETVIHGSYSLTWTDAHLHQQLITVLRGPVVDSFDMEFRILYAASVPAPDMCRVSNSGQLYVPYHQPQVFSDFRFSKHFLVEPEMTNPPSPPEDVLLDWKEMGVVLKDISNPNSPLDLNEEMGTEKMTEQNNNRDRVIMERFTYNGHLFEDERRLAISLNFIPSMRASKEPSNRINENTAAVTTRLEDNSTTFSHTESLSSNTSSAERIMRMERKVEKRLSKEFSEEDCERARISVDEVLKTTTASFKNRQHLKWETFLEEESTTAAATEEITASSRKPVILKVSNTENFSSLSDIMKRIKQGPTGLLGRNVKSTMSDRTRSMMDLSDYNANINHKVETGVAAPRFPGNLNPDHMTPALALMKKRNNAVKSSLSRTLQNFTHLERTHSSSYITDIIQWKSRYNKDEELENK